MNSRPFNGVFAIMATPFDPDEAVDRSSLRRLVEWEIDTGVHGLTILGIFGEAHRLSDAERDLVIETVVDQVRGRVPVVVGLGHQSARVAAEYARRAQELGADGLMVMPSPSARSREAVVDYFRRVADVSGVPLVLQDEPTFTGVDLPAPLLAELAEMLEPARYAKLEAPPTPPKVTAVLARTDRLGIFGGMGGVFLLEELERGAVGTMTGFAFPEVLVEIYRLATAGDWPAARDLFYRYLPAIRYEAQAGISLALRKEILRMRGAIDHSVVRQPAPGLDETTRAELWTILAHLRLDVEPAGGRPARRGTA